MRFVSLTASYEEIVASRRDTRCSVAGGGQRPVVIAVIAVRMMQMAVDQIVDVIAVRHRFVTAAGAMLVVRRVCAALVRVTAFRVLGVDFDPVFVDVVAVRVVKVTIVQIVLMLAVLHGDMAAARAVPVRMVDVVGVGAWMHAGLLRTDAAPA
jgi:hypothetical protein